MSFSNNLNVIDRFVSGITKNISDEVIGNVLLDAATSVYKEAVKETPQWSGYMASNLTISVDGEDKPGSSALKAEYKGSKQKPIYKKGSSTAVEIANSRNMWVNTHEGANMNSVIELYYANPQPYYAAVENYPQDFLREVNLPGKTIYRASKMLPSYGRLTWTRTGFRRVTI